MFFSISGGALLVLAIVLGLALGGIATLLSYQLPARLQRQWRGQQPRPSGRPRTRVRAVPFIGWYLLRRRDAGRKRDGLGWHLPWPELVLALLFALCAWRFEAGWLMWCAMAYCMALMMMAWMDARTCILPDILTLPFLWAGLLVNLDGALAPLPQAVLGAVVGYGFLWLFFHVFKRVTGREGMGYGDFKLTAALGAWLGIGMLPAILLVASLAGVVVGVADRLRGGASRPLPFAPYLALAGIVALLMQTAALGWMF